MPTRAFGKTGWQTTPVAFGAMRITANDAGYSPELLYALERGINFIDTARNYGESEVIIGKTLDQWTGARPYLSTKVKPRDVGNWRFYVPLEEQFTARSIVESVDTSLRTLGVDCLDLVQLHQWYYLWGQREEWLETLRSLRQQGKLRHIGVSAQDHEHDAVLALIADNTVDAVQLLVNLFESRPFVSVVQLAGQHGVGVIARCIFDHSGALSGEVGSDFLASQDVKLKHASPRIVNEYLARIERLRVIALAHEMSLAEMAIRFVLGHSGVSNLAISLSTREQVDAAVAATGKGALPADLFRTICREHDWIKNFYYCSTSTVDGNR